MLADSPGEKFSAAALAHGSQPALLLPGGDSYSYSQLSVFTEQIAAKFSQHHIGHGSRVMLIAQKSPAAVAVMMAVHRCGACFVPADDSLPAERIRFLISDVEPHLVITDSAEFHSLLSSSEKIQIGETNYSLSLSFYDAPKHTESIACILYTSGSTGIPKGVCISPEAMMSFVNWGIQTFQPGPGDVFSSIAPLHFDLSVFDMYVALFRGASVLLFSSRETKNPRLLAQQVSERVSICYATPSTWRTMMDFGQAQKYDFAKIRAFLFAGEIFPVKALHQWKEKIPAARYFNLYGPTETNVSHAYEVKFDSQRTEPYPIGKLLPGFTMKVDETSGELLLAGQQVFSGYWKKPELNEKVFETIVSQKYYRTGDRVTMDENGNCVFAGRIDRQLKINGFRIEPGEVENVLMLFSGIADAAVTAAKDSGGYDLLLAFVVKRESSVSEIQLREFCVLHLPAQAVPHQFYFIPEMPKTSSGKTDYPALQRN